MYKLILVYNKLSFFFFFLFSSCDTPSHFLEVFLDKFVIETDYYTNNFTHYNIS